MRWRETERAPDGSTRRVQRSLVVDTEASARVVQAKVIAAIERGELYEREAVREIPPVATVDDVLGGWLEGRAAYGVAKGTLAAYGGYVSRILRVFRAIGGISEAVAVPGTMLTQARVAELTNKLRAEGAAESTIRSTVGALVAAWTWACDDPTTYPGLAPAPRDPSRIVPRPIVYTAAPAPTMAECDAVLRRLAALHHSTIALPAAVIARCTGLRMGQVLEIRAEDVSLSAASLTVTSGKSAREKAERRTIPIAPVLVQYLAPWVARREDNPHEFLFTRRSDLTQGKGRKPDQTLRNVWEAATAAGEVRRETWEPPGRSIGRPGHAFRAAFQHHLVTMGVRDEIIDALVGHAPTLRGRHYVDASARWDAMVQAVATIPPIAWEADETATAGGEVIPFPS